MSDRRWHIDMLVVGSQKALMSPAGPGLFGGERQSLAADRAGTAASILFRSQDSPRQNRAAPGSDTPWTPAHTLIAGLAESLKQIRAEGIEAVWADPALLSRATIAGHAGDGARGFAARPAEGMTAVPLPAGIDGKAVCYQAARSRFGVRLAGGQVGLEGKIFRLAHFGLARRTGYHCHARPPSRLVLDEIGHAVTLGICRGRGQPDDPSAKAIAARQVPAALRTRRFIVPR